MASDPVRLATAVSTLHSRFYADGTPAVKSSKLRSAEGLAARAGFTDIYPLSEAVLDAVAAALLAGGYRSGFAYILELKLKHIELNFPVGPALGRRLQKIEDALGRGLGPKNKAPEVAPADVPWPPSVDDTLVLGATDSFIVSSAWLLREIETADLDYSSRNVKLLDGGGVSLALPMSKTDQRGCGAVRSLACHCSRGTFDNAPAAASCGPCAVRRQLHRMESHFGIPFDAPEAQEMPLFPDLDGSRPSKKNVILAWFLALLVSVTGHSARRSGAKHRARTGWSVWQVQFFGRWASAAVLEYIEEALAETTFTWSMPTSSAPSSSVAPFAPPPSALASELASISNGSAVGIISDQSVAASLAALSDRADAAEEALVALRLSASSAGEPPLPEAIVDIDSQVAVSAGKIHYLPAGALEWPRPLWATLCGWRWGSSRASQVSVMSGPRAAKLGQPICTRCARGRAKGMGADVGGT